MPFLRFSRDKRGYEHTYLVQATNRRGKPVRPRILYWYRTPPGVGLGRTAFDDDVKRLLEAQHPEIVFDWPTILSTAFPSQEPELWRERRRAERAAKQQARREEEREAEEGASSESASPSGELAAGETPSAAASLDETGFIEAPGTVEGGAVVAAAAPADQLARKRRRRGGRRRGTRPASESATESAPGPSGVSAAAPEPYEPPDSASEDPE